MRIGEIILIPFPFSELNKTKVRPAVVITETKDKYQDLVVSAISSVVPKKYQKGSLSLSQVIQIIFG
jgi:hypothetical protein